MPIGSSKLGVLGAGLVPGGSVTFNTSGNWSVPPGVKKVSITGKGATGNPGNPGNPGNAGNFGIGGAGGGGSGARPFPAWCAPQRPVYVLGGAGGRVLNSNPLYGSSNLGGARGGACVPNSPCSPFSCTFPNTNRNQWYSGSVTGGTGPTGGSGQAGQAGTAGNPGNTGQSSSGLGNNFSGGAGGNAGAAGNAGNGGSGGPGGSGGAFNSNATANGGTGGTGGGSGGSSGNNVAPGPQNTNILGGAGGGGAGVNNDGGNGCPAGPVVTNPAVPGDFRRLGGAGGQTSGFCFPLSVPAPEIPFYQGRTSTAMSGGRGAAASSSCLAFSGLSQFDTRGPSAPRSLGGFYGPFTRCVPGNPVENISITNNAFRSGTGGGAGANEVANNQANRRAGSGGGGGGRGNAGNPGGAGGGGGTGATANPTTFNCVPVTPGATVPITVASPGGQVIISWNPQ